MQEQVKFQNKNNQTLQYINTKEKNDMKLSRHLKKKSH